MSNPLIMIDTAEVREGRMEEVRALMEEFALFVRTAEPRIIAYQAYLDEEAAQLTTLQIHPDCASARFDLELTGSAFSSMARLIRLSHIDVYGEPSPELLNKLQRKAEMLGADGDGVHIHPPSAGFERFPAGSLLRASRNGLARAA